MIDEIRTILRELGENPSRDGLARTPERVESSLRYLTSGYSLDADSILNGALFDVEHDEMVIVKDIEVFSLCEHHMIPFFGKCHVAYLPTDKVVGLSKIPRLVDMYARRLQVQERLTLQIAETLDRKIRPRGVAVVIEARHLCMIMRGVEKQNSVAVTSSMLGIFKENQNTRNEFLPDRTQLALTLAACSTPSFRTWTERGRGLIGTFHERFAQVPRGGGRPGRGEGGHDARPGHRLDRDALHPGARPARRRGT